MNTNINSIGLGFYDLFIRYAQRSTHPKHRHVAVLISTGGQVVAWANNVGNKHAEKRALDVAGIYRLDKPSLIMISVAITKAGKFKLAKPCRKCQYLLKINNVKNVYYSTNGQQIVRLKDES